MAGVSVGTVDRVIHKRGQVSEENRIRILQIIDDLKYRPNLLARSLASKRNYVIVTLLPEYQIGKDYWEAPILGIQKGWKEIADFNVKVINLFFDQNKVESFTQKTIELIENKPDAVLIAPVFQKETTHLANALDELSIPYIFIDSNIDGVHNLSYFGQHSYQSGYLAARLLQMGLPENKTIAIIKPLKSNVSNQTLNREQGFNAFFEQNGFKDKYNFLFFDYSITNEVDRKNKIAQFFSDNPSINAAVIFNSKVYEIAATIDKLNLKDIRLIGYDLLKENTDYLRKGIVTFLIAQRPEEQGYQSILTLFNYLVHKQDVAKVQYIPMDILTKENIDYYMNFKAYN